MITVAGWYVSEIHLPILSRVKASPLDWLNQWGKIRPRIVIGVQGATPAKLFYCRPYSGPHSLPIISWVASQLKGKVLCIDLITFHWVAWGKTSLPFTCHQTPSLCPPMQPLFPHQEYI
jgi:hypothetical protein